MSLSSIISQVFGLAKESVRGTAETTPIKWYPTRGKVDLDYKLMHLQDDGIRGTAAKFSPVRGILVGDGKVPLYFDPQHLGEFFQGVLGTVASAEDTTITIGASNNKLDFNIGGGTLTATIPSLTYAIGLTQATAGSLCKAIYDAIVAAEAVGTYTVTYSRSTKLFTIARSAGTFQMVFLSGTNNATSIDTTLGYTHTDKTGAITYTGATQVEYAFTHTFTRSNTLQKQAFTLFVDRSMNVKKYNLGVIKKMAIKSGVDNLIEVDVEVLFKAEAAGSIGSPSFPTQRYLSFEHVDFKIAGVSNTDVKEFELTLDNTAVPHRALTGSQTLQDILCPGKLNVEGSFTIYFQDTTERDKFLANTNAALNMVIQGATIAGSSKWGANINVYAANYKSYPYQEEEGLLAAKVTFDAFYSTTDSKEIQVALTNQDVSY